MDKDCWFWVGPLDTGGRPMVYNQNRQWPVVRLLYVIQNGPLPERRHLINTCGQPRCCRPDHFREEARGPIDRPRYTTGTMPVCANGHPQYPQNQYIFRGKAYLPDVPRRRPAALLPTPESPNILGVTLTRISSPVKRRRWRVEVRGGHLDGVVIDCADLGFAVGWYEMLLREQQGKGHEEQSRGHDVEPGRTGGQVEGGHHEQPGGDE